MNTTILVIVAFSIGLAFGGAFFGTCPTRAFEWQDNPSTRMDILQMKQEQQRLRDQQQYQQYEKRPCP